MAFMSDDKLSEYTIETLSHKVDQLIRRCDTLKSREKQLLQERARLLEQNAMAKTRVEAMIDRLKTLQDEHN